MDLKNKLTEEEIRKLGDDILTALKKNDEYIYNQLRNDNEQISFNTGFHDGFFEACKQAGIIRKSAKKETDEYIASMSHAQADIFGHVACWKRLEQLIAAERAEENKNNECNGYDNNGNPIKYGFK